MTGNLANKSLVSRAGAPAAAGTSAQTSSWVDTLGYNDVDITVLVGAIVSGGSVAIKLQYSSNGSDSLGDVEGSAMAITDAGGSKAYTLGLHNPQYRYVRMAVTRSTQNSTIEGYASALSSGQNVPTTAMVAQQKQVNAAPLGTA